ADEGGGGAPGAGLEDAAFQLGGEAAHGAHAGGGGREPVAGPGRQAGGAFDGVDGGDRLTAEQGQQRAADAVGGLPAAGVGAAEVEVDAPGLAAVARLQAQPDQPGGGDAGMQLQQVEMVAGVAPAHDFRHGPPGQCGGHGDAQV